MYLLSIAQVLPRAAEEAYADATHEWCKEHARGERQEEIFANEVVEVHVTSQLRRGGTGNIQVTIITRKPWKSLTNVYRLEKVPGGFKCNGQLVNLD